MRSRVVVHGALSVASWSTLADRLLFGVAAIPSREISYVMEPFEESPSSASSSSSWFTRVYDGRGKLNLTLATNDDDDDDDVVFGRGALRVDYEVVQTQNWGGFVDLGRVSALRPHVCAGADRLSLWYKVVRPQSLPGRVHLRVLLLDDSDCVDECAEPPGQALENYYSFHYVLDDEPSSEWRELSIGLRGDDSSSSPFWRTGWTGVVGNNALDPARLRGWRIELSMDSQAGLGASSAGEILLDQLACVGGADLLAAPFRYETTTRFHDGDDDESAVLAGDDNVFSSPASATSASDSFAAAVADGTWRARFYDSERARARSDTALAEHGALRANYTIEQTENWGGFNDYAHTAPGPAYYNLSGAEFVSLRATVERPLDAPGRAQARLILMDGSDCLIRDEGSDYPGQNLENYYSFHPVLEGDGDGDGDGDPSTTTVTVALRGGDDSGSPLWRTGWTGQVGNNVFDKETLKGYRIELNVDSQGDVGSTVSGVVVFDELKVIFEDEDDAVDDNTATNNTEVDVPSDVDVPSCVKEPGLSFDTEYRTPENNSSKLFRRVEFLAGACESTCLSDPTCAYAYKTHRDCHLAASLRPDVVGLQNTVFATTAHKACWRDDAATRGDFCERCACDASTRTIDCRGRGLTIVPKTFGRDDWTPLALDLRDNPSLVMLGTGALDAVAADLTTLRLPAETRYASPETLRRLPALAALTFGEDDADSASVPLVNAVASLSPASFYGDVCCAPGNATTDRGLRFCRMSVDVPGADSTKEPFVQYVAGDPLVELKPSSPFMAEAAESAAKCAEYCAVSAGCGYYTYDARWKESEHRCSLLRTQGAPETICCSPDDYGDRNGTTPGYTSGRPPRTRSAEDDAAVLVAPRTGTLRPDPDDDRLLVATYGLSLGSTPLRGAVWTTPKVDRVATSDDLSGTSVTIDPPRVALYDDSVVATVVVVADAAAVRAALGPGGRAGLAVTHDVVSCDAAFAVPDASATTVFLEVVVPNDDDDDENEKSNDRTVAAAASATVGVVLLWIVAWSYAERRRRAADAVWAIRVEDLRFADPPEIVGRGTFGLVLLAEYRGTQVAVKRVIPPRDATKPEPSRRSPRRRRSSTGGGSVDKAATTVRRDLFGSGDRRGLSSLDLRGHNHNVRSSLTGGTTPFYHRSNSIGSTLSSLVGRRYSANDDDAPHFDPKQMNVDPEAAVVFETDGASEKDPGTRSGVLGGGGDGRRSGSTVRSSGHGSGSLGHFLHGRGLGATLGFSNEYSRLKADFVKEMRHLSKLRHPCITTVMGAVIGKYQEPMLVMEYMDHGSLYDVLHNDTIYVEGEQILPILRDIAHGLRFLHAADPQVIHGDLKAANILVDGRFRAKVADFGLSQKKRVGATGTPFWMAPELLRRESPNTAASDVYSFGVILYEVYSRDDPYKGEDFAEVLKKVADPVLNYRPRVPAAAPPDVQYIMAACWNNDILRRPTFEYLDNRLKSMEIDRVEPFRSRDHPGDSRRRDRERVMTENLLFQVFPKHVARALLDGVKPEPEHRDAVTVFFSDIVGFTDISSRLAPVKISDMLDRLYNRFDALSRTHDVFKVETIGDAYMAVTNLVKDQEDDHAARIAAFAIDALEAANATAVDADDPTSGTVSVRVGFHTGPVVANVVGSRNPRYCLFGDTVNTASRMESNSVKNRIHCSERAAKLLQKQDPTMGLVCRGRIEVKGKGEMVTYWVNEGDNRRTTTTTTGREPSVDVTTGVLVTT